MQSSESFLSFSSCLSLFEPSITLADFVALQLESEFKAASEKVSLIKNNKEKPSTIESAERVFNWCQKVGARILYPNHPLYPEEFLRLEEPPLFLSCLGRPVWRENRCISVVGSREPSARALGWMENELLHFILATGAATISGGARGIDQKTHALSLRAKKPTVVFLPSGLADAYPPEIVEWEKEVLSAGGAIVSQYSPFQSVRKMHFEGRNRLIAALGQICFVVEARRRSGSIMTARLARELDRTVCVLPCPPGEARSAGTLDLLFDGGFPLRDSADLQILFDFLTPSPPKTEESRD